MTRYFIEVAYKGTNYAGFQIQQNANTIQAEIEKALLIYYKQVFSLTGSSRTDAGVHALQNYFHFDTTIEIDPSKAIYHINAILPADVVVKSIKPVNNNAHCRFDALSRTYTYTIYQNKNPFIQAVATYVPFPLQLLALNQAAAIIPQYQNFKSFSKKNTQVHTYNCTIIKSSWLMQDDVITYTITGNRFLRGMVRGLVATMLQVAKGKYNLAKFEEIIASQNPSLTDFSAPAKGLTLQKVTFAI